MLTTADVARQIRLSPATIAHYCRAGIMPARQNAARSPWAISAAELAAWKQSRTAG